MLLIPSYEALFAGRGVELACWPPFLSSMHAQTEAPPSLYERLGGQAAVLAAVNLFYSKMIADPQVSRFFEGLDMTRQVKKQIAFMTRAFDGPDEYKGRDLTQAHAVLVQQHGLSDAHFDITAQHLRATLEELGVAPADVDEALEIVASTRDAVLGRG